MIKTGERLDDLNIKGYHLIQNPKGFCFGLDAVLLVHFANAKLGESVLDIGTGTGIIPILMAAYYPETNYQAIELQESYVEMAQRSVKYNNLEDRVEIKQGDVRGLDSIFPLASFDRITVNPPYMNAGLIPEQEDKAIARHEITCTLEGIVSMAAKVLKSQGSFCMVHRPNRLPEVMSILKRYRLEPKRLRLVQAKAKEEPNLFLIEAVRNAKPYLRILPTLVIYEEDGSYTPEVHEIYRYDKI